MTVYCLSTLLFLVVVTSPVAAFGIQGVRGVGTLVVDGLAVTALQRSLPPDLLGRVFGAFFTAVLAAISVGVLITPPIIDGLGLDVSLWLAGGLLSALCRLGVPWLREMDDANVATVAALEPRLLALGRLGCSPKPVAPSSSGWPGLPRTTPCPPVRSFARESRRTPSTSCSTAR